MKVKSVPWQNFV